MSSDTPDTGSSDDRSRIFDTIAGMFDTHPCAAVSDAVRDAATERGMTQAKIAADLGMTRQALNARLRGHTHWTVSELPQLAQLTGRTVDELIGGNR